MTRQQIVNKINNFSPLQAQRWISQYPDCESIDEAIDREYASCQVRNLSKEQLFHAYEKLIYKHSWYYSRKYNMDFDEIKSQAFLVFCETIEKYDGRSAFSTFLYHRLRTLNDYCKEEKWSLRHSNLEYAEQLSHKEEEERLIFYQLVNQLSVKGKMVIHGLITGIFEKPEMERQIKVGKYRVVEITKKNWGWNEKEAFQIWFEIKDWWNKNNSIFI